MRSPGMLLSLMRAGTRAGGRGLRRGMAARTRQATCAANARYGEYGMTPTDLLRCLPGVTRTI